MGQTYSKHNEDVSQIYKRFDRHCKDAIKFGMNVPGAIDKAIYKYGCNNFKVELIEECNSISMLILLKVYRLSLMSVRE
jgi:hypothetical protein